MKRKIKKKLEEFKEERKLLWFLKQLDKKLHIKVKRLKKHERKEVLCYVIISKLKEKHLDLEHKFLQKKKLLRKSHSGVDYLEHKINKIPSLIKLFEVDFEKQEFKKICDLFIRIEREVENV